MENPLNTHLRWYRRHPDFQTTPLDRAVSKLTYCIDETPSDLGMVCETSTGEFWCFTTNPAIQCPRAEIYLRHYQTQEEAELFLFNYAASELLRLMKLNSDVPYIVTRRFKQRDRAAFKHYTDVAENGAHNDVEQAFKCGMEWILRSEGTQRRPKWAKYLVQHRNGVQTWFEDAPVVNDQTGFWETNTGRQLDMLLHQENWRGAIVKLT